ncbi:hypothetical protein SORBI_3002G423100 [Sorghum bicolor]|uniref:polynucleotide adenylyltransferase n=1 Tax=Sorghum bicolor TaxID=4558 RepID=A0A1B6QGE4_SORBI|nr:hypothetical protein SORBI_3002G423100 [Sorghum bicolor]
MAYMAAVAPVPWWPPPPELAPVGFPDASSPAGYPKPQTLPFLLAPTPPPPPPPPPLPAGYPLLPPPAPIIIQLQPDPSFVAEVDQRRSSSLVQFLKDEGAVPSPEDEKKREKVIRELKKAHGPESDIDVLCVGPCIATLQYHFFVVLRQLLEGRPEVSELQTIEKAKVPLMRFRFTGIAVDFTYAQLPVIDALKAINTFSTQLLQKIDTRSWRSLSGVRVNEQIVQLVPNAEKFQALLRCIKLWARKRGLHCHYLGFFAGIHLAILAAYVCRKFPDASVNGLFAVFFQTFAHWPWQVPDSLRHDFQWTWLFEPFPYDKKYQQFLRIALCAPTFAELRDWAGWVKSRFRLLILKLERAGIECDPCPSEEVDHTDNDPNVVFYWGLIPERIIQVDTSSLKEDFMESITNDVYGTVKCTHSDVTISVVGLPQLPKSMRSHVHWQYMQRCMMAYEGTDEGQSAGWLGLG